LKNVKFVMLMAFLLFANCSIFTFMIYDDSSRKNIVLDEFNCVNNVENKLKSSSVSPIFDGMYTNYIANYMNITTGPSNFSYSSISGNTSRGNWYVYWDDTDFNCYWDVDVATRIMTNVTDWGVFDEGHHDPGWIFTIISLGSSILIAIGGLEEHTFNITDELIYDLPGYGSVGVWVLEDLTLPGNAWYEKSTGILLKGSFLNSNGENYTLDFVSTNVEFTYAVLPGSFALSFNAGTPDDDGNFNLTWTSANSALSYSVYEHSSYIAQINESLTLLLSGTTDLTLPLTDYSDGTYYFIVVAHNDYGDTLSNCIKVEVKIPSGTSAIPGYNLCFLLSILSIVSILISIKIKKS
jgi:hypothetical protein